jgi:hypothetical protein
MIQLIVAPVVLFNSGPVFFAQVPGVPSTKKGAQVGALLHRGA